MMKTLLTVTALAFALTSGLALAQTNTGGKSNADDSSTGLESTITTLPENAQLPGAVTSDISVPTDAATQGIQTANDARKNRASFGATKGEQNEDGQSSDDADGQSSEDGQSSGNDTSAAAKDDGQSFGEDTSAAAKDSENDASSFGATNSAVAQNLENDARAFGEATSAAAEQNQEALERGSTPDLPAVQNLPAIQDPPGGPAPASPGKP